MLSPDPQTQVQSPTEFLGCTSRAQLPGQTPNFPRVISVESSDLIGPRIISDTSSGRIGPRIVSVVSMDLPDHQPPIISSPWSSNPLGGSPVIEYSLSYPPLRRQNQKFISLSATRPTRSPTTPMYIVGVDPHTGPISPVQDFLRNAPGPRLVVPANSPLLSRSPAVPNIVNESFGREVISPQQEQVVVGSPVTPRPASFRFGLVPSPIDSSQPTPSSFGRDSGIAPVAPSQAIALVRKQP